MSLPLLFVVFFYCRCHLPFLYIGLEYGLTSTTKLAEKFFLQAQAIAPDDPFVVHEIGVIEYQNGRFVICLVMKFCHHNKIHVCGK